jgi:DNA-binding MarR family transcriptional regulator
MVSLLNSLMGVIVLPYLGSDAAARELAYPQPSVPRVRRSTNPDRLDLLAGLSMRVTYRTLLVLRAVSETPGVSNRGVGDAAGVTDQGQISKLLSRLQKLGLVKNATPGQPSGGPNEWHLTSRGEEMQQALQTTSTGGQSDGQGEDL